VPAILTPKQGSRSETLPAVKIRQQGELCVHGRRDGICISGQHGYRGGFEARSLFDG
jgi:threonine dehydrogenase-like Zn-dependent dehydrogenase